MFNIKGSDKKRILDALFELIDEGLIKTGWEDGEEYIFINPERFGETKKIIQFQV